MLRYGCIKSLLFHYRHATADSERKTIDEATSKHVLNRRRGAILPNVKEADEKTKVERWLAKTVQITEYSWDRKRKQECEKRVVLRKNYSEVSKCNVNKKETVKLKYKSSGAECQINKNVQTNLSKGDSVKKQNISSSDKLPKLGALRKIAHNSKSGIQVHYPLDGSLSHHADGSESSNIGDVQLYTVLSIQQYNKSNLRKGLRVPPTQERKTHTGPGDQPHETNPVYDQMKPFPIHCQRNKMKTDVIVENMKQWGYMPSDHRMKQSQTGQPKENLKCYSQQKTTEVCNNIPFDTRKQYRMVSDFGAHTNYPLPRYSFIPQLECRTSINQTCIFNPAHQHHIYPYVYQTQRTNNNEDNINDQMRNNYPQVSTIRRHREISSEEQYQPEKQFNISTDQFQHPAYFNIPSKQFQYTCRVSEPGSQRQCRPSFEDVRQLSQVCTMSQSTTDKAIHHKVTPTAKSNLNGRLHQTTLQELNIHALDTDTLLDMSFSEQYGNIMLSSKDLPNSHFGVPIPIITMTPASPQPASTPSI